MPNVSSNTEYITRSLDKVEKGLPPAPRLLFKLNRSIASLGCSLLGRAVDAAGESTETIGSRIAIGTRTVQGQARSAAGRTAGASAAAVNEVVGQARAQTEQVLDTIDAEAQSLAADADDVVDGADAGSYTGWTKAELYDRAQELSIDGRSSMSRAELIEAVTSAV